MGNKLYNEASIQAIANSIRSKTGGTAAMKVSEMATAINGISSGSANIFGYSGTNPVHVASLAEEWSLADTTFDASTTPSTTSTTIKNATNPYFTNANGSPNYNYGDSDIIIVQQCLTVPTYGSGCTNKARMTQATHIHVMYYSKVRATGLTANGTRSSFYYTNTVLEYYGSSGTFSRTSNSNYGLYMTPYAPSLASSSADTTSVKIASPYIYCRGSSSYSSVANLQTVTDCSFKWKVDIYTVDAGTSIASELFRNNGTLVNDGLSLNDYR